MAESVRISCIGGDVYVTQLLGPYMRHDVEIMMFHDVTRMTVVDADNLISALTAARERRLGTWHLRYIWGMRMRITIDIDTDTAQELDRYKHKLKAQGYEHVYNREDVAGRLLTAWAHAQQRKRATPITQQPR